MYKKIIPYNIIISSHVEMPHRFFFIIFFAFHIDKCGPTESSLYTPIKKSNCVGHSGDMQSPGGMPVSLFLLYIFLMHFMLTNLDPSLSSPYTTITSKFWMKRKSSDSVRHYQVSCSHLEVPKRRFCFSLYIHHLIIQYFSFGGTCSWLNTK